MSLRVAGEPDDGNEESKGEIKELKVRDSDHLDAGYKLKKNFEFPKVLNYDAHVSGFTHDGSNWGVNIIMSNGAKSMLPMPVGWKDVRIADDCLPQKIILWYNYHNGHAHLNGV